MPSSLSWWQQRLTSADAVAPAAPTELLHQHHWDYIVIGSGLAGVSTAFFLAKNQQTQAQQASILVLERRSGVASGATGRNGGHLWPKPHDHGDALAADFEERGVEEMLAWLRQQGPNVEAWCEVQRGGSLELASTSEEQREYEMLLGNLARSHGQTSKDVEWWSKERCQSVTKSDYFYGALYHRRAGSLNPLRLTCALAQHAQRLGVHFHYNSEALSVASVDAKQKVTAKLHQNGAVVELHAKHAAIICCNAWAPKILPELADIIMPERNQVMMTAPIGRSVFGCEGFCAENENLYGIQRRDGRICFGGIPDYREDAQEHTDADNYILPHIGHRLQQYLRTRFPEALGESLVVEEEWSGVLANTPDSKPLVGVARKRADDALRGAIVLVGVGFNGNGMSQCFGAGKALGMQRVVTERR